VTVQPEIVQPEIVQPVIVQPEIVQPETVQPETVEPSRDVSDSLIPEDSAGPVQEECIIDLSGTDRIIEKIDIILSENPASSAENAIAKLWLPPYRPAAAHGPPMSRTTTRG